MQGRLFDPFPLNPVESRKRNADEPSCSSVMLASGHGEKEICHYKKK